MRYDVIVVGGGHAGVEAATAAARRGASTALLTFDPNHVGAMSCNPAIGGLGKGHLVREVDAFDGIIARAADAAAIHHRLLNRSKGAAVQGPRVQADRAYFHAAVQAAVAGQQKLTIMSGEAVALEMAGERIVGVRTPDRVIETKAVVLATGTFLGGRLFCGDERKAGGRIAERGATRLADQLREIDLPMARLKTGTPPRLDGRTIDWAMLDRQASDEEQWSMSPATSARVLPQLACAITRTNERGHDLIRGATSLSPLYDGSISAGGPRYCPSIEDKVVRFPDRDGHQIFLEPEGLRNHIVYPNGISTSLPRVIQQEFVRTIAGLHSVEIVQPGYAVEYDYIDPRALDHRLAVASLPGLFCAGQINGTTGYEEAAAQGLIAGLNAAAHALGLATYVPSRTTSYLGVMIDDLVLQGVTEPYRMLTARAEFRLALRADNADTRLTPDALALGCLSDKRIRLAERRAEQRELARAGGTVPADILREVEEDERYRPYVVRQNAEIERIERDAAVVIPKTLRFERIPGLSTEMIERLTSARPASIAEVSRMRGVTPAALSAIWLNLRKVS